ncbi:MAG TPA: UDP-N-acetylmuramate dehydrogenase [Rhodospirillales bacterium]|nr:UDP-N-acetylmuramate dehydrogenase [Rhodospirillales bacterium]
MVGEQFTPASNGLPGARLLDRLPDVRGRYKENVALGSSTWFKVGGKADVVFRPADENDLADFLAEKPDDIAVTIIGVASNILVRDGGIPGVVIRLGRGFSGGDIDGEILTVGAAGLDVNVAIAAEQAGLAGLEFLSGVPGTIGGALRMNAGAYGGEIKDIVRRVRALDESGRFHDLTVADMGFGYRHCSVPESWIFVSAVLQGCDDSAEAIAGRMADIAKARRETQPTRTPTGGSTFANPPGETKAWQLIDAAGCRGLRRGGAMVSELHCNFLINTGNASAADLEGLGEEVRERVRQTSGITLHWEIRRIGVTGEDLS